MADVRIVRALLAGVEIDRATQQLVFAALASKDASELTSLTKDFPVASRKGLRALMGLYGDQSVLTEAAKVLSGTPGIERLLADLRWLSTRIGDVKVTFDLSDLRGYSYYSGARFAIYADGASDALVRGGRYDEVGAVFGRNRPAAGFSLDLKQVVGCVPVRTLKPAIRAPWGDAEDVRAAISELRGRGETVVCVLPGHESEVDEFRCDRELLLEAGEWTVRAI
jgi:ATP phosphoribosyltransferase regulatory subunit